MDNVGKISREADGHIAIQTVVGPDGKPRYIVELPGVQAWSLVDHPQDVGGAVSSEQLQSSAYTRAIRKAMEQAGIPEGADVMLVGHSLGGIAAMDLAGDPSFNGGKYNVTHVMTAGSPISTKEVAPGAQTRVLSVENTHDIVTHVDGQDSMRYGQSERRMTYQFSDNYGSFGANHAANREESVKGHRGYAEHIRDDLKNSPNPYLRSYVDSTTPYLRGTVTDTKIYSLRDNPPGA
ncbi:hypothetical protein LI90_169 [Carbonactinospora thermoautotrophica]|uniref:Fungal lipase-type domain-containing protein n=1 Tax=Carbonactinospora thermoautotrophica TaxID=1469144 RepID=A0A132ML44_9ACTN|nr:hypothetical protein [Carbonactinospora thermoautotrophica]KWW98546.1 hypothetical protein LI90_169 [Carbonactinospora thermoautotrophica]